jgi:hypothetical protein
MCFQLNSVNCFDRYVYLKRTKFLSLLIYTKQQLDNRLTDQVTNSGRKTQNFREKLIEASKFQSILYQNYEHEN